MIKKYKYVIYDIEGCLVDSQYTYEQLYNSYEEAENQATKEIQEMIDKAKKQHEDILGAGYYIKEVEKSC
ncbi:MAG: hypothetical protein NC087_10275 [Anaeroplasma bactoclasticum]|nr:hypothetical protein [Anaeroplasma bactoclasticum]